jgi:hypothetical protein
MWPLEKRIDLWEDIQLALTAKRREISPILSASILGNIRSVTDISPWGPYLSFSLSEALKRASWAFQPTRLWWSRGKYIRLSKLVVADTSSVSVTTH